MEQESYVKFISLHIKIFKILGFWKSNPNDKYQSLYDFYTILCTVLWIFCLTSQIVYSVMVFDDMNEFTDVVYLTGTFATIFLKTLNIYQKLDFVKFCIGELDEPLMQPKCQKHLELSRATRSFHKKCYYFFISMAFQITACFAAIPLFVEKEVTVLKGWYPFNWKQSPFYEILYLYQVTVMLWNSLLAVSTDMLVFGLLMQIGLQCECLCEVLNSIEDFHVDGGQLCINSDDSIITVKENVEQFSQAMTDNLIICIRHYSCIRRLSKDVEYMNRYIIMVLFLCGALVLCLHLFQLTQVTYEADTTKFVLLIPNIFCMLAEQFLYCWYGNEIIYKSEKILFSAYNTPWVECNMKFKKTLLNFMTHTLNPIEIKAGGLFTMSNSLFISILHSSYSYFTVLQGIQEGRSDN